MIDHEIVLFGSNMFLMAPARMAHERLTINSKPSLETRVTYSVCELFDILDVDVGVRAMNLGVEEFGGDGRA